MLLFSAPVCFRWVEFLLSVRHMIRKTSIDKEVGTK